MAFSDHTLPKAVFKVNSKYSNPDPYLVLNHWQIVIGILFILAMIGMIAKTAFQLRAQKRIRLEDAFLIYACVFLAAGTGVLYSLSKSLYGPDKCLQTHDSGPVPPLEASNLTGSQQKQFCFVILTWIAIYCVKFSFLLFLRQLVDRIWGMLLFWRAVVAFAIISLFVCISEPFFSCAYFGAKLRKSVTPRFLMVN